MTSLLLITSFFVILAFMANIAAAAYINSCDDCDIAWLYKDAQMFGFDKYKALVGGSNAICPGVGPILETDNVDFIALMNSCPCKYLFLSTLYYKNSLVICILKKKISKSILFVVYGWVIF